MNALARWLGTLAAITWLLLSALVAASSLLMSHALPINLIMAAGFAGVGALLWWRVRVVDKLQSAAHQSDAVRSLVRVEIVTSAAMAFVGLGLLSAALFRVLKEGMTVFG